MKKILFPILVFGIILTMSDCDNNEAVDSQYYPYEVTNLQYTIIKGELVGVEVTWDVPNDPNFSHVKYGLGLPDTDPSKPKGENSTLIVTGEPISPYTFFCISKDGKVSKGVRCTFGY